MKKTLSLFLSLVIVFSLSVTVGAVGAKEYLGDMSFNRADGFEKINQTEISCVFQHTTYSAQTISLTYLKGYLAGLDVKNIAEVDENSLKNMLDNACSVENLSNRMTSQNGFKVNASIGEKYAGMKENNAGIPIYFYEFDYTGSASGKNSFYGHYAIAVFGYYDNMYMFEFDRPRGESSTNNDFIQMLHTVQFGGGSSSSASSSATNTPSNSNAIKIKIDGSYVYPDSDPLIKNDRTIVPIRAVAEKLGYDVSWDASTRTVTIVSGLDTLKIKIGQKYMDLYTQVPGENYSEKARLTLDAPADIINDRTYLPLRAIGEALGCSVSWDSANRTVLIES